MHYQPQFTDKSCCKHNPAGIKHYALRFKFPKCIQIACIFLFEINLTFYLCFLFPFKYHLLLNVKNNPNLDALSSLQFILQSTVYMFQNSSFAKYIVYLEGFAYSPLPR